MVSGRGKISDPLISKAGNIYSAAGILRLFGKIFPNRVDDPVHLWNKSMCRSDHHDSKQQSKYKRK